MLREQDSCLRQDEKPRCSRAPSAPGFAQPAGGTPGFTLGAGGHRTCFWSPGCTWVMKLFPCGVFCLFGWRAVRGVPESEGRCVSREFPGRALCSCWVFLPPSRGGVPGSCPPRGGGLFAAPASPRLATARLTAPLAPGVPALGEGEGVATLWGAPWSLLRADRQLWAPSPGGRGVWPRSDRSPFSSHGSASRGPTRRAQQEQPFPRPEGRQDRGHRHRGSRRASGCPSHALGQPDSVFGTRLRCSCRLCATPARFSQRTSPHATPLNRSLLKKRCVSKLTSQCL